MVITHDVTARQRSGVLSSFNPGSIQKFLIETSRPSLGNEWKERSGAISFGMQKKVQIISQKCFLARVV